MTAEECIRIIEYLKEATECSNQEIKEIMLDIYNELKSIQKPIGEKERLCHNKWLIFDEK